MDQTQANQAAMLDVLMYFDLNKYDKYDNTEKKKISYIISDLQKEYLLDDGKETDKEKDLKVLNAYLENHPDFGDLVISNVATSEKGYTTPNGLNAAVFTDSNNNVTVAYRGTGSGEWLDNGEGLGGVDVGNYNESQQQAEALRYFEDVMEANGYDKGGYHITVTGHSKGGNKAQYVTLMSHYADLISVCYNYDGQAFSPEAVEKFKLYLGDKYDEYASKLYTIAAEYDYVNPLGTDPIVPKENRIYVTTDCGIYLHKNHYPYVIFNPETGEFNELADGPGWFPELLEDIMEEVMTLDPSARNVLTQGIMTILQSTQGDPDAAVNGDKCDWGCALISVLYLGHYVVTSYAQEIGELVIGQICQSIADQEKEILDYIATYVSKLTEDIKGDVENITLSVKQGLLDINTFIENAFQSIHDSLEQLDIAVKEAIRDAIDMVKGGLLELKNNIVEVINGAIKVVEVTTVHTVEGIKDITVSALNHIESIVITGTKNIRDNVVHLTDEASDMLHTISKMSGMYAQTTKCMNSFSGRVTSVSAQILSVISGAAGDGFDTVGVIAEQQLNELMNFFDNGIDLIKSSLSHFCDSAIKCVRQWAEGFRDGIESFTNFIHTKVDGFIEDVKVVVTNQVDSVILEIKDKVNDLEYKIKAEINTLMDITEICQSYINDALDVIQVTAEKIKALSVEDYQEITTNLLSKLWGSINPLNFENYRKLTNKEISLFFKLSDIVTSIFSNKDGIYLENGSKIQGKDFSPVASPYQEASGKVGLEFDHITQISNLVDRIISDYNPKVKNYLESAQIRCSQLRFSSLDISQEIQECYDSIDRQNRSLQDFMTQLNTYKKKVEDMEDDIVTRLGSIKVDCKLNP